jgi:lipopolysaccharide export system permease protein
VKILDRYVIGQFLKIFLICVLGVPFLFQVIDLTDRLDNFLSDGVGQAQVFAFYFYQLPYQMLLAFPIACLLAAVFTFSRMTRHFEVTAAKAGGVSFYRLAAPMLVLGMAISLLALSLSDLIPESNRRAAEAIDQDEERQFDVRLNFVFRGDQGRYYFVRRLNAAAGTMKYIKIDREGTGYEYPSYSVSAPDARWDSATARWVVENGHLRYTPERDRVIDVAFAELWQAPFVENPYDLLAKAKAPEEMDYAELGRFIEALERSGENPRKEMVQQALKISFPFTCFIIVLFGAPLANSTRRGGAALSIGLALTTTIVFLTLIRVGEALGAGGVMPPVAAAWLPNAIFFLAGVGLMAKVKT